MRNPHARPHNPSGPMRTLRMNVRRGWIGHISSPQLAVVRAMSSRMLSTWTNVTRPMRDTFSSPSWISSHSLLWPTPITAAAARGRTVNGWTCAATCFAAALTRAVAIGRSLGLDLLGLAKVIPLGANAQTKPAPCGAQSGRGMSQFQLRQNY